MALWNVKIALVGIVIVAILWLESQCFGAEWELYLKDSGSSFYYDKESIKRSAPNIVTVWQKFIVGEADKKMLIEKQGKIFKKLGYFVALYEIDCERKINRIMSGAAYSAEDELIDRMNKPTSWLHVIPDTLDERQLNYFCQ